MFRLRTFGGLALERDGTRLDRANAQRKTLVLLAILAVSGETGVARDRVMLLLWPESDSDRARGSLNQMLHSLRRQLGTPAAIRGSNELRLDRELIESDVAAFQDALASGALEDAAGLYTGPFLDGVHLDDALELERWVEAQRARLATRHRDVLQGLVRSAEVNGDLDASIMWLRRLQAADPLNARVAVSLMTALCASGDRGAALQHARIHAALVREELGVDPDPAVASLAERLREPSAPVPQGRSTRGSAGAEGVAELRTGDMADVPPDPVRGEPLPPATGAPAQWPGAGDVAPTRAGAASYPRLLLLGVAVLLVAGIGAAIVSSSANGRLRGGGQAVARARGSGEASAGRTSVAVLPFVDLSPERDQGYFSDGITEEIIAHLARVPGLRVTARTSAFQFKGTDADIREIGRRLGVATVLEGSVRKAGDRLRITTQLVSTESGYRLWSQTYERELRDVFAVQDEISRAITNALRVTLPGTGTESPRAVGRTGESLAAYELYLKGRYFMEQRTEDAMVRASGYFQQAVTIDPEFARAYAGLADVEISPRPGAPEARFRRARAAAAKALAIDPTLAEAHTSMGWIMMWHDRDWRRAEAHFVRAIELNPGYAGSHIWYSGYLGATGQLDEALVAARRAHELDPLSMRIATHLGTQYLWLRQPDKALQYYRKALEIDSTFFMAHWGIASAYLQLGRPEEALRELRYTGTDYAGFHQQGLLGYAHARAGHTAEARRILEALYASARRGHYVPSGDVAIVHIALGEHDRALEWLARYAQDRGARLFLKSDPLFDPVRGDPRFERVLAATGLQ